MQGPTLITGASSGIGEALALHLARDGRALALVARREDALERVAERARAAGAPAVEILPADLDDLGAATDVVGAAEARVGPLSLVVANAGANVNCAVPELDLETVEGLTRLNYLSAVATLLAASRRMVARRRGHLVGVSSLAAFRGLPTSAAYGASKAALASFLESARVDLAPHGVLVTTAFPGFVRTPMTDRNDFRMPGMIEAPAAARRIAAAIARRQAHVVFPASTGWAARAARLLPPWVYDPLVSLQNRRLRDR